MRRCYHKSLGKHKKQNDTSIKTIIPNSGWDAKQLKLKLLEELQNFKVTLENWPFLINTLHDTAIPFLSIYPCVRKHFHTATCV